MKKILCLVLSFVLLLMCFVFPSYAADSVISDFNVYNAFFLSGTPSVENGYYECSFNVSNNSEYFPCSAFNVSNGIITATSVYANQSPIILYSNGEWHFKFFAFDIIHSFGDYYVYDWLIPLLTPYNPYGDFSLNPLSSDLFGLNILQNKLFTFNGLTYNQIQYYESVVYISYVEEGETVRTLNISYNGEMLEEGVFYYDSYWTFLSSNSAAIFYNCFTPYYNSVPYTEYFTFNKVPSQFLESYYQLEFPLTYSYVADNNGYYSNISFEGAYLGYNFGYLLNVGYSPTLYQRSSSGDIVLRELGFGTCEFSTLDNYTLSLLSSFVTFADNYNGSNTTIGGEYSFSSPIPQDVFFYADIGITLDSNVSTFRPKTYIGILVYNGELYLKNTNGSFDRFLYADFVRSGFYLDFGVSTRCSLELKEFLRNYFGYSSNSDYDIKMFFEDLFELPQTAMSNLILFQSGSYVVTLWSLVSIVLSFVFLTWVLKLILGG